MRLSKGDPVRRYAAYLCLAAWGLAAVAQLVVMVRLPSNVVAFGVDVTHASHALLIRQLLVVALGVATSAGACASPRLRLPLLILASLVYLVNWFPWRLMAAVGPVGTFNAIYLFASTPGMQLMSLTRDVVLPVAFATAIVLGSIQKRLSRS
jgi:hypothetical protein